MSTFTTAKTPDATADAGAVDAAAALAKRVDELAEQLHRDLVREQKRKHRSERVSDKELWKQALATATVQARAERVKARVKAAAADTVTSVYADVRAALHRNRRQLVPWQTAAPYALAGETANLLATYGSGSPVGICALCAAAGAGGGVLAWHKKLAKRTPAKFAAKAQAGLALLAGWTAGMPLVSGTGQAGMWLGLVGGSAYMSLSWWRAHDHPIPLPDDLAAVAEPGPVTGKPVTAEPVTAEQVAFAERVMADWVAYVAGQGTLPGSKLTNPQPVEYGWTWLLHLVRGKQKLDDVRAAKPSIAAALNVDRERLSIDTGPDHTQAQITIITEEVTNAYDGPRVVCDGGDVFIEIGPYEDGLGAERFHVLSGQLNQAQLAAGERPRGSMNGGFALGTKGSGKSRLLEELAVGLRELGIEIWYLDPQRGKSSPALMAEADWPLSGLHGSQRGAYSNVVDLWKAVKALNELRSAEGAAAGDQGFQHTRRRPGVMVKIDECHGVFGAENPETGNSFGEDFADLDREMRKNGIGMVGASQSITQDTFGRGNKAAVLRDGMCAVNVFVMSYGGKNLGLVPGYDGQPAASLPSHRGYGYNPKGERPHVRWQARYTPDFQPWLARYPKATLDARAQKRIGKTYLNRFDKYEADQAAAQAFLDDIDACEGDASGLPGFGQRTDDHQHTASGGVVLALLSPYQRRLRAAGMSTGPTELDTELDTEVAVEGELTGTEQRVLDILRTASQSPTTLASHLGVTPQAAGRHLRNLASKRYAAKLEDGRYMAKI
ncbi:MAG: hypothetical protein J2P19_14070 [Pseudonocardia sp.]|nr:hypothetical protein [Pseudonocardia sp.]